MVASWMEISELRMTSLVLKQLRMEFVVMTLGGGAKAQGAKFEMSSNLVRKRRIHLYLDENMVPSTLHDHQMKPPI
jgi:hypothetical protein